jgi:hypothetical protein
MYCRVCGSEESVKLRVKIDCKPICKTCYKGMPKKVSKDIFDLVYWQNDKKIPEGVKKEFYSDYLYSLADLETYLEQTTSQDI